MEIVIIGSGNVASVLGRKFTECGHRIVQVAARNKKAVSRLAAELETGFVTDFLSIMKEAAFYLFAVSDDAINDVAGSIRLPGKLIAHTSGSVSKNVLKNISDHFGVFYPLQSMRYETTYIPEIPVLVDGSDHFVISRLENIAGTISDSVFRSGDEERKKLHLAAVTVNNFTNHLFTLASEYCRKESLDFQYLLPLIRETCTRIGRLSPASVQTGPAMRNDWETVNKHLGMLQDSPALKKIYELMSESIGEYYRQ